MFHHRSQTPLSNSHASSLQSSSARDHTECQEIRKVQMAPPASTFPTALPRIPASVKLPAQTNQSLEFLQPSRSKQVNGPSKERWEERPRQSSLDYDNEKGGGSSDLRHDSLRSHSEKSYGEQSHRDFARHSPSRRHHTTIDFEPDDMEDESIVETHSVWILIYLSCLAAFLSAIFSLYTIFTVTVLLLIYPISFFCVERRPLGNQIRYFLLPPIAFQLNLFYSEIRIDKHANSDPVMLVLVNVFGPIYATWISASAWVAAGFWAFTAIMGDPDGQEGHGGKEDGRAAVLGVKKWWETWLARVIR